MHYLSQFIFFISGSKFAYDFNVFLYSLNEIRRTSLFRTQQDIPGAVNWHHLIILNPVLINPYRERIPAELICRQAVFSANRGFVVPTEKLQFFICKDLREFTAEVGTADLPVVNLWKMEYFFIYL
ncbi:hypothetical protein SMSP2_02586 [Limihaloglobus sulfuriphilus]|uniref:Uncharacterized protein n=1 Tax=Limihaloglobus sulfuriphilus TaxID=1851148 RepID=A0A1Q2MHL9_9BACT|nr:hypothetical protein SMSP2_02586 [Limihaloglobus sulfuriphilus]